MAAAEEVEGLKAEIERLGREFERERAERESERQRLGGIRVKDLSAANFIKVWRGDHSGPPIGEFLATFKDFAEAGLWTDEDKIRILRVKLEGAAKLFLNSRTDLRVPNVTFEVIERALEERFKDRQPDQHHYSMFQSAVQKRGEDPHDFLDRLRALGELTETKTNDPVKQEVIRSELQKRLLAVFTNGLYGIVGEQVRFRLPKTIEEALQIAVTVHTEEKKRHNYSSQGKGTVFTTTVTCYTCNKAGHMSRDCRQAKSNSKGPKKAFKNPNNRGGGYDRRSQEGNQTRRVECYRCHKLGHYAKECNVQVNQRGSTVDTRLSNQNYQ